MLQVPEKELLCTNLEDMCMHTPYVSTLHKNMYT